MISDDIRISEAGSGCRFLKFGETLLIWHKPEGIKTVDLGTGDITPYEVPCRILKDADEEFVNLPADIESGATVLCSYGKYLIVVYSRLRQVREPFYTSNVLALSEDSLVGRLKCEDEHVTVYRNGVKTSESTFPRSGGGSLCFPTESRKDSASRGDEVPQ
jgi:hypothetical protein